MNFKERIFASSQPILIVIFMAVFIVVGVANSELFLFNLYPNDLGQANIFFIEESYPYGNVKNFQIWFNGSFATLIAIRVMWLVEKLIFKDSSKNYLHSYEEILIEKRLVWWYFFIGWFLWVFTPIAIYFLSYINSIFYMWNDTIWNLSFFLNIGFTYLLVRHFMNMKKRLINEKNK